MDLHGGFIVLIPFVFVEINSSCPKHFIDINIDQANEHLREKLLHRTNVMQTSCQQERLHTFGKTHGSSSPQDFDAQYEIFPTDSETQMHQQVETKQEYKRLKRTRTFRKKNSDQLKDSKYSMQYQTRTFLAV